MGNRGIDMHINKYRIGRKKGTHGAESMLEPLSPDPFFSSLEPKSQPGFLQLQIHICLEGETKCCY